jgi:hypothetical protein
MVAFVLLHELVHYAMGHLDYIGDDGAAVIGLRETRLGSHGDGPAPRADLPWGALRVLEFQADTQAFFLLCGYALAKDGPCRRFEALLERDNVAGAADRPVQDGFRRRRPPVPDGGCAHLLGVPTGSAQVAR